MKNFFFRLSVIPFCLLVTIGIFINFISYIISGKAFLSHFKKMDLFFSKWEELLFDKQSKYLK